MKYMQSQNVSHSSAYGIGKKLDLLNKHGRGATLQGKATANSNDFRIHFITDSVQNLTDVPL